MSGVKKLIVGEVTLSKSRGDKFIKELNDAMKPEKICARKDEASFAPKKK